MTFHQKPYRPEEEEHKIFKVIRQKNLQSRILYPARLLFRFDGEVKSFTDRQKLKEFSVTKYESSVRNTKGTYLYKKTKTRNKKIMTRKISLVKANI